MHLLALVTDAFGGHGGIAKFNRDLLSALCKVQDVERVVALPRLIPDLAGPLPAKLEYMAAATGGKFRFALATIRASRRRPSPSAIICGHINLLPLAFFARWFSLPLPSGRRPPIVLVIHGIDAWQPTRSALANRLVPKVEAVVAVSEFTRKKFWAWAQPVQARCYILPNCVDLGHFTPGPKQPDLLARYGLGDKTVLLTVARLSAAERYKGIDEVLQVLPALVKTIPNLSYLIVGDGTDRERLQRKAGQLGLRDRVIFAGRIPEAEKVNHFRLADAFVMPGSGEGFGIVYLEAMACGVPVVASKLDASREAVLDGKIGGLVDPRVPEEVSSGMLAALRSPKGVPAGLNYFSSAQFQNRVNQIARDLANN